MDRVRFKLFSDRTFSDCIVNFVGYEFCTPGHSFGPAIRPSYIIHYIISGKGKFYCNNDEYELHENNAFLIEPNVMTFYQADFKEPWEYIWIGFNGNKVDEILKRMGLSYQNPILFAEENNNLQNIVEALLSTDSSGLKEELKRQALLYDFLSFLCKNTIYSKFSLP